MERALDLQRTGKNALKLLSLYYRVEYAEVNLLPCSQVTLQAHDTP